MIRKSLINFVRCANTPVRPLSSYNDLTRQANLLNQQQKIAIQQRNLFSGVKDKLGGKNANKAKKEAEKEEAAQESVVEETPIENGPPTSDEAKTEQSSDNFEINAKIEELEKELKMKDEIILKLKYGLGEERDASKRLRQIHEKKLKLAAEPFCKDILPVYDALSKGVEHATKDEELSAEKMGNVVEGMEMTLEKLNSIFKKTQSNEN